MVSWTNGSGGDAAHAPSSSSGQGVSLVAESAIELARCLRDLPTIPKAFAAYERLRGPRVEKIAAEASKTNRDKRSGPVAKAIANAEKLSGATHRYRIDLDARAGVPAS